MSQGGLPGGGAHADEFLSTCCVPGTAADTGGGLVLPEFALVGGGQVSHRQAAGLSVCPGAQMKEEDRAGKGAPGGGILTGTGPFGEESLAWQTYSSAKALRQEASGEKEPGVWQGWSPGACRRVGGQW